MNANKTTGSTTSPPTDRNQPPELLHPERPSLRHHQRTGSNGSAASTGSSFLSRTASPAKFDKLGRRILTPPNTRTSSAYGSIPGTPRGETEVSAPHSVNPLWAITSTFGIASLPHTPLPLHHPLKQFTGPPSNVPTTPSSRV